MGRVILDKSEDSQAYIDAPRKRLQSWRPLKQRRLLLKFLGRRLLLVDLRSSAYGHCGYEFMMAAKEAVAERAHLYAFNTLPTPNEALFRLKGVRSKLIFATPVRDLLATAAWKLLYPLYPNREDAPRRLSHELKHVSRQLREESDKLGLENYSRSAPRPELLRHLYGRVVSEGLGQVLHVCKFGLLWRRYRRINAKLHDLASPALPSERRCFAYLARTLIDERREFVLSEDDNQLCLRQAEALGIPAGTPTVALHVRESGYKAGHEIEHKPNATRRDSVRNANITTYFSAVDRLVNEGYTVVRIGDRSMTPVHRLGLIDLATSSQRTDLLELYFLSSCRFLLASESGPSHICYLFGTPTLMVNATDVIGSYPIRRFDRYIFKQVSHAKHNLSFGDLISAHHYNHFRDTSLFEYIDNSPAEILEAVDDMLHVLNGNIEPRSEQEEIRKRILGAALELRGSQQYVRRWGADAGTIGNGYIGHSFARALLASERAV
jgi:putative glycosyltransferase (TIGR04372 family)